MIKLAILGVVTAIIALQFKEQQEYGIYLGIIASIIILGYVLNKASIVVESVNKIYKYISIDNTYIKVLLRMIGITYIAEFSSQICKDAGYGGMAKQIEIGGKFTILAISMPVMVNLIEIVSSILK